MRRFRPALAILLLQLILGTAASAQPSVRFTEMEQSLLDAKTLSLSFNVYATGAVEADITGSLRKQASGDIEFTAKGDFAGQHIDLIAALQDDHFEYGTRAAPLSVEPPSELWQALVIGLTRMGVLHNIANLSAGAMPDHAQGGVTDWVEATNIEQIDRSFAFDIVVSGTPSGSATLSFDQAGRTGVRFQTVAFPGGEMRVEEQYFNMQRVE